MGPQELWFRACERSRMLSEQLIVTCGRAKWSRERLSSRLLSMSPSLVRAQHALVRRDWQSAGEGLHAHFVTRPGLFPLDPSRRESIATSIGEQFPGAAHAARTLADRLLAGRYDLLGYQDLMIGASDQIDWHFDPVHARRAPRQFWTRVPYLDPRVGDHKIIWELNRHQHWLMLGRAAWLTNDSRYAESFRSQLASWLSENPPLTGINWSSMLELGFRAISWLWAIHFFVAVQDESSDWSWLIDALLALDAQLNHISRHLSTYFSPNTHLLGEGLALYVAGRVLPELRGARNWEALGRQILKEQARRQVHPDGGHAELSAHYHRYALDFYLLALVIARLTNDPAQTDFAEVASRLAVFCRAIAEHDGRLPTIGDDDGGLLFPICGRSPADASDSLSLAASLLDRPDLAVTDPPEETLWMLGGDRARLRWPKRSHAPKSHLFPQTGYAVLRSAQGQGILDVGPHGFLNGGHAHADALSLVLSIEGRPLLVDPGTSTYTMDPDRRDLFRSTAMHNTPTVDGLQQSISDSPFHWRTVAKSSVRLWRNGPGFDAVEGEHDGYLPQVHRRAVLRDQSGLWLVADHLLGKGRHQLDLHWHLDPAWHVTQNDRGVARIEHTDGSAAEIASTGSELTYCRGGELGWRAPVYGQRVPAFTLHVTESGPVPLSVVTAIAAGFPEKSLSLEAVEVATDRKDNWHRSAVAGHYADGRFIALFSTEDAAREGVSVRSCQRIHLDGNEFHTDARLALLGLSRSYEPTFLTLIEATTAVWTGPSGFQVQPLSSAADLHLDRTALIRLSHGGSGDRSIVNTTERTLCAE
jgi:hypothetical protein